MGIETYNMRIQVYDGGFEYIHVGIQVYTFRNGSILWGIKGYNMGVQVYRCGGFNYIIGDSSIYLGI